MIKPKSINFKDLVKNSNTTLSLDVQSKIVDKLNNIFTEQEQHWYIANLYMYMNYHPTNDFPINLDDVFKMIGFANKENAKRTLKNNFIENDDYVTLLVPRDEQKLNDETRGGHNKETVMLNIDTFKNLCMIAKTEKGKEIRKYYVKLENIYNEIIKEEIEQQKVLLENNKKNVLKNLQIVQKKIKTKLKKIILLKQIHSNKFHFIDKDLKLKNYNFEGDALITNKKEFPIAILTADCAPILIYDEKEKMIAAIHAGWKGAFKGIIKRTLNFMIKKGCDPKNVTAVIGPCISVKNYEVKKDFIKN